MDEDATLQELETKAIILSVDIANSSTIIEQYKNEKLELDKLKAEAKREYEKSVARSSVRERELSEILFDKRRELLTLRNEADSVERQATQLKKSQDFANQYAVLEKQWDLLTIGAPWRKFYLDHQLEAAQKITYFRKLILADTMGLGKTLSSLMALDLIEAATREASVEWPYAAEYRTNYQGENILVDGVTKPCGHKVLYFCPSTMIHNVERELRHWAPHRNVVLLGGQTRAVRQMLLQAMQIVPDYVVVCNYEAWRKDKNLVNDLIDIEFDTCIIDEAHNIKDRKSVAYRGIHRIVSESKIPFVIPMTGTPILNRPQELFALLTLVDSEAFYSENQYLRDYCEQDIYTSKWSFKSGGLDRLAQQISNRYLRRTKEQAGIKLPSRTIIEHEIIVDKDLYPEQARARSEMNKWGSIMLDPMNAESGSIAAMAEIAVYTRLRQIETWPAGIEIKGPDGEVSIKLNIEQSQKLDEVIHYDFIASEYAGLVPEIASDERIVVFSQFTKPLIELKRRCEAAGYRVAILTGDTKDDERQSIIQDFDAYYTPDKSKSRYDILLAHYRVGGVGANFTAATQMIILDEEWNAGKRDQAYDRIHRIGQDKPVTIHVLRMMDTIDEWLSSLIDVKENMVQGFHDSADTISDQLWKKLKGE